MAMTTETRYVVAPIAYTVLFGFLAFLAWEVIQTPFYVDVTDNINLIVWYRVHCTLGDVGILLSAMGVVSAIRMRVSWVREPSRRNLILVTLFGVAYTIFSEYVNVRIVERWAYSPLMPTVVGIGLIPIAQWILLPAFILRLATVQARGGEQSSSGDSRM